ncbi:MAG: hypothetical protein MJE66_00140 [Proteobacteria bacterium]|nr:hypothetical protein [Pseudomonadota bacterium]
MESHDLRKTLAGLDEMQFAELETFNQGALGVFWTEGGPGASPWEMHPDTDELLQILEGESIVTVLTDAGPQVTRLRAVSCLVVPRGCWHRQEMPVRTCELFLTPGRTEHSTAEDPRKEK